MARQDEDRFAQLLATHVKLKTAADLVSWARSNAAFEVLGADWFIAIDKALRDQADAAFKAAYRMDGR